MENLDPKTKCDICGREFYITPNYLDVKELTLMKEGLEDHQVKLTSITCPLCGKSYPVLMDDDTTAPLVDKLYQVVSKKLRLKEKGFPFPGELLRKERTLEWKLDFKRRNLAEKYNGSLYQLGDSLEQLDYRYHTR